MDSRFELDVLGSMSRDHHQGARRNSSKPSRGGKHGGSAGSKKTSKKRKEAEGEEGASSTARPSNETILASQVREKESTRLLFRGICKMQGTLEDLYKPLFRFSLGVEIFQDLEKLSLCNEQSNT